VTPQSCFMVVATIVPAREASLRELLQSMNSRAGNADPGNPVLPFGAVETLHYARLVVVDDAMQADLKVCGVSPASIPTRLVLMGDCDGPAADCLAAIARVAEAGLRRLFAHCEGFAESSDDVLAWMRAHDQPVAVNFICRLGRTVRRVREDDALWRALAARVPRGPLEAPGDAQQRCRALLAFVEAERRAGHLTLTNESPTPLAWQLAKLLHLVALPLLALLLAPLWLLALPFALVMLRRLEKSDPEWCPRPDPTALRALQELEDFDVTNQFSAIGPVKPGWFRRLLVRVILLAIQYTCRHIFHRGYLARVQTIHFARWVVLDDTARVFFASNYDGGHEAYMDDFINKVGWGLNLVFSNGVGWPRTSWLLFGGAKKEPDFKRYQRRHQIPTQVWYKAYPGLTLTDLERAGRIRDGLRDAASNDATALAWLRLI
jgi:hypothetical protein